MHRVLDQSHVLMHQGIGRSMIYYLIPVKEVMVESMLGLGAQRRVERTDQTCDLCFYLLAQFYT
jgi:hypothetical protein